RFSDQFEEGALSGAVRRTSIIENLLAVAQYFNSSLLTVCQQRRRFALPKRRGRTKDGQSGRTGRVRRSRTTTFHPSSGTPESDSRWFRGLRCLSGRGRR